MARAQGARALMALAFETTWRPPITWLSADFGPSAGVEGVPLS